MMKFKKYVLTDDNQIYDITKLTYYMSLDGVNERYQIPSRSSHTMETETINNRVIKTSDNILDLVVPCTLWDLDGDLYEVTDNFMTIDKVFDEPLRNKEKITAIYKRQPNGDYKRYEVKA